MTLFFIFDSKINSFLYQQKIFKTTKNGDTQGNCMEVVSTSRFSL